MASSPVDNTLSAGGYDNRGNLLSFPEMGSMTYTAHNKMATLVRSVAGGTTTGAYVYDGLGQRIKRVTKEGSDPTVSTYYIYDAMGRLAQERSTVTPEPEDQGLFFRTTDHLGSTRLITTAGGTVYRRHDFLPFGEDIPTSVGGRSGATGYNPLPDAFAQRFTAKERDDESGLDYFGARYFSASLGRFTSPDAPFADQYEADPQSWNLYSYVRNNPLKFVDETGREIVYADRRLQIISDARRQQSPSYNAGLQGFEGPGSPRLTIQYGPTANDPDGSPTNGVFSSTITPAIMDCSPTCVVKTPTALKEGTITVNDKYSGDPNQTSDTLAHEVSHANDARTNPERYSAEKVTDAKGRIIPHDSRPVEQRAISGAKQSNRERKDFQKRNPEQNKQINRQRDQQLKQENERRKREGQN